MKFGRYPQNNGDTPEPIEWLVLEQDEDTALLISRYSLDCRPFFSFLKAILFHGNWRDCDLRKWLNRDFYGQAFNEDEQRRIIESKIYTSDNPDYGTKGCGETQDKVFCLSIEDAWKYFGNVKDNNGCSVKWHSEAANIDFFVNRERACQPTAYALLHGAWQGKKLGKAKGKPTEWWFDNCWFWLRSPGSNAYRAAFVDDLGAVDCIGYDVDGVNRAVRPVLRIKL